jgi:RNA-binding protein 25
MKLKIMKKLDLNNSSNSSSSSSRSNSSSESSDEELDKKQKEKEKLASNDVVTSNGNHNELFKQKEEEIKDGEEQAQEQEQKQDKENEGEDEEKKEEDTICDSLDKKLAEFQSQITPNEETPDNTPNDALNIQYQQLGVDNMSEESMNMSSDDDDDDGEHDLLSPKQNEIVDSSMDLSLSPSSLNSPSLTTNSQLAININSTTIPSSTTTTTTTVMIKKQINKNKLKTTIQPRNQVFADDEDDDASNTQSAAKRAAKLQSLQQQQQIQQAATVTATNQSASRLSIQNIEERKKAVKKLVESIPSDKDDLFKFNLDWSQIDTPLMDKRIKPWINRKIIEYIGEEEQSLNEFICSKIQDKQTPDKLLDDIKVILDDEAELFVKKLWRLLVYETESKRLGLSK